MMKRADVKTGLFFLFIFIAGILTVVGWHGILIASTETHNADQDITEAVEHTLRFDKSIPFDLIDIEVHQGIVTLIGNVPHYRAKQRAATIVETIKGVESVINGLTVAKSDHADNDILKNVQRALKDDPATDSYDIHTSIKDGTVTLEGNVPSLGAKDLSGWVATGVEGVRDINNNLIFKRKANRSDDIILREIKKRLEADAWINEDSVIPSVKEGVVTLNGVVGSVFEKKRVVRDSYVAGVKNVDEELLFVKKWAQGKDRRKREWRPRSDEEINETLTLAYLYDPRVSAFNVRIKAKDGIVTLNGHVNNLKAKQTAEETAKHTRGVLWVKNFLKVRPGTETRDEEITRKVKLALHDDPFVNQLNVTVFVVKGTVILHGTVHTEFQKTQAEEAASTIKGVIAVHNNLHVVERWIWKPDPIIQNDIENELWWSPYVDSDEINVTVNHGTATLTGTVDSYFEQEIAIENAREGGAKSVISHLTIRNIQERNKQEP